jgi:SMODS and SLOG-associating 2TM effector domain 1/Protein of unknown function (DUF4231)
MGQLELTARRQASWSNTANRLKSRLDRVRWGIFTLSVLGAVLATVASQLPDSAARRWVAIASAIVLGVATFLTARLAAAAQVGGWVRARAAAEALKREAFKFAVRAAPYQDAQTAEDALKKERAAIEDGVEDLNDRLVEADQPGSAPAAVIAPAEYLARRVKGQIDGFYRPKAEQYRLMASRLRAVEFALALLATIITAAVGVMAKHPVSGFPFDLAALTAIVTTIGALVLAHIEASRYDFLVTTYRATARRLEDALADLNPLPPVPSPEWSAFVDRCETIIAAENSSWVAKWTGTQSGPQVRAAGA